jgi:hypothetical protein
MADRTAEIAILEAALNSGAKDVTVDGNRVVYQDAAAIRRRIVELQNETNGRSRRPRAAQIWLGGQ